MINGKRKVQVHQVYMKLRAAYRLGFRVYPRLLYRKTDNQKISVSCSHFPQYQRTHPYVNMHSVNTFMSDSYLHKVVLRLNVLAIRKAVCSDRVLKKCNSGSHKPMTNSNFVIQLHRSSVNIQVGKHKSHLSNLRNPSI